MWTIADFSKTRWSERNLAAIYCAKHGDDRNDGHPRRPVASLSRACDLSRASGARLISGGLSYSAVVVGSGVYSEALDLGNILVQGDGFVTFDGFNTAAFDTSNEYEYYTELRNVRVQNYLLYSQGRQPRLNLVNCVFNNVQGLCDNRNGYPGVSAVRSLFRACFANPTLHVELNYTFDNCTFIGTALNWVYRDTPYEHVSYTNRTLRNCYLDAASSLLFRPDNMRFNLVNSNIQGSVSFSGPIPSSGNTATYLADFQQAAPARVLDCVSTAPGFNNPGAMDYTLAATSQMRNLATDGGFIGAYGIGINFSGLADADQINNCQWNSSLGSFVLANPELVGSVEFVVKDFLRNWILEEALLVGSEDNIDNQTIDATISYEQDGFGAPANVQSGALEKDRVYWVNGYDTLTYAGRQYLQGQFFPCTGELTYEAVGTGKVVKLMEAPNIRLYELKYSTISAVDCVSRPWQYFQFNKVPTVDASGRSNGDPLFDPSTANPITVHWQKLRITLMPHSLA